MCMLQLIWWDIFHEWIWIYTRFFSFFSSVFNGFIYFLPYLLNSISTINVTNELITMLETQTLMKPTHTHIPTLDRTPWGVTCKLHDTSKERVRWNAHFSNDVRFWWHYFSGRRLIVKQNQSTNPHTHIHMQRTNNAAATVRQVFFIFRNKKNNNNKRNTK